MKLLRQSRPMSALFLSQIVYYNTTAKAFQLVSCVFRLNSDPSVYQDAISVLRITQRVLRA
jgi:hypothetical protein